MPGTTVSILVGIGAGLLTAKVVAKPSDKPISAVLVTNLPKKCTVKIY